MFCNLSLGLMVLLFLRKMTTLIQGVSKVMCFGISMCSDDRRLGLLKGKYDELYSQCSRNILEFMMLERERERETETESNVY